MSQLIYFCARCRSEIDPHFNRSCACCNYNDWIEFECSCLPIGPTLEYPWQIIIFDHNCPAHGLPGPR